MTDVALVSVVDGDTIVISLGGTEERVRLIGIDAPETEECLAEEARGRLAELLERGEMNLERDASDRDAFGRLLRYVFVGDVFVNEELVEEGLAMARRYEPDTARAEELEAAQASAMEAGMGMWAGDACPGSSQQPTLVIAAIHPDAAGDDNANLNDEWVEVANQGDADVRLDGWAVKDESASHRFRFPPGFVLRPGATVRIRTGCGTDTASDLHWCNEGSAVWNNGGDTVFLLDPGGEIVSSRSY